MNCCVTQPMNGIVDIMWKVLMMTLFSMFTDYSPYIGTFLWTVFFLCFINAYRHKANRCVFVCFILMLPIVIFAMLLLIGYLMVFVGIDRCGSLGAPQTTFTCILLLGLFFAVSIDNILSRLRKINV